MRQDSSERNEIAGSFPGRAPLLKIGDNLLCTSPDGNNLVLREMKEGWKEIATLEGHEMTIYSTTMMGDKLVSGGWDNYVKVWDLSTKTCLVTLDIGIYVNSLCVDPATDTIWAGGYCGFTQKLQFSQ